MNAIARAHDKAPRTHSDVHSFPACRWFIFVVIITNCIATAVEKFRRCCRAGWVDPGLLPGAGRQFQLHEFWRTQILDSYQAPGTSSGYMSSGRQRSWTAARHRAPAPTTRVLADTEFKALLWRELPAYHGGTIFEHNPRKTELKSTALA